MSELVHRRLRAPTADGAALIAPPLDQFERLMASNRAGRDNRQCRCQGLELDQLAKCARTALLRQAIAYCQSYRDVGFVPPLSGAAPLVLGGHQPELFHPGVWFKNFLLSSTARRSAAVAINLIVDTDAVHSTSIRVPAGDGQSASVVNVPFDVSNPAVAFEEQAIQDPELFHSFANRVGAVYQIGGGPTKRSELILEELWRNATSDVRLAGGESRLGLLLAQSRHRIESRWGLETLELPLSHIAQDPNFRRFMVALLMQLPRLWSIYNAALEEYRHVNGVRSRTHPVPNLGQQQEWLEAPFLVWTKEDPVRRHLFVKHQSQHLILDDRTGRRPPLYVVDQDVEKAVEQLEHAETRGIRLRPRALITTMYARLVLSDLFIHGIGGAKYDELTDLIIRRFFGIEPPAYATATATFRLPIKRPEVSADDVRKSVSRIRDLRFRPESFLNDPLMVGESDLVEQLSSLAAEKREWLDKHSLRRCSKDVFGQLDKINRSMQRLLHPLEEQMRARHAELIAEAGQSRLLGSREFSFVLFPAEILPARLLDLCQLPS